MILVIPKPFPTEPVPRYKVLKIQNDNLYQ